MNPPKSQKVRKLVVKPKKWGMALALSGLASFYAAEKARPLLHESARKRVGREVEFVERELQVSTLRDARKRVGEKKLVEIIYAEAVKYQKEMKKWEEESVQLRTRRGINRERTTEHIYDSHARNMTDADLEEFYRDSPPETRKYYIEKTQRERKELFDFISMYKKQAPERIQQRYAPILWLIRLAPSGVIATLWMRVLLQARKKEGDPTVHEPAH